jgi:glucans biosynthesis protein
VLVEPLGEWGQGVVQLVEIPAESENNDNIISYWRPKTPLTPGQDLSFAYRQLWCWEPPEPSGLAVATQSRSGRAGSTKKRRFVVEFTGGALGDPKLDVRADLTATQGAISGLRTFISRERRKMRVVFDLEPAGDQSELRLALTADGKPVSETWLYRWTP